MPLDIQQKLVGWELVQAFLRELHGRLLDVPYGMLVGTPREIVEEVVRNTDRFASCNPNFIDNLSKQVAMAIGAQGGRFRLSYERVGHGEIKVAIV